MLPLKNKPHTFRLYKTTLPKDVYIAGVDENRFSADVKFLNSVHSEGIYCGFKSLLREGCYQPINVFLKEDGSYGIAPGKTRYFAKRIWPELEIPTLIIDGYGHPEDHIRKTFPEMEWCTDPVVHGNIRWRIEDNGRDPHYKWSFGLSDDTEYFKDTEERLYPKYREEHQILLRRLRGVAMHEPGRSKVKYLWGSGFNPIHIEISSIEDGCRFLARHWGLL